RRGGACRRSRAGCARYSRFGCYDRYRTPCSCQRTRRKCSPAYRRRETEGNINGGSVVISYITNQDVDSLLGPDWAPAEAKDRAVMVANVRLTKQRLPELDTIPNEWKQAGAEIAKEAAAGRIYGATETGVLSKTVSAGDGVGVS